MPFYDPAEYHSFIHLFMTLSSEGASSVFIYYQDSSSAIQSLTYGQVDRITTNLACSWSPLFEDFDMPVGFIADQSLEYFLSYLAILKLGLIFFAISPRNSEAGIADLISQGGSRMIISTERYAPKTRASLESLPDTKHIILTPFDMDTLANEPLHPDADDIVRRCFTTEDETRPVMILHSSGTTGHPKLRYISNLYLLNSAQIITYNQEEIEPESIRLTHNDVFAAGFPMCHLAGLSCIFTPMMLKAAVVIYKTPLSAKDFVSLAKKTNMNVAMLTPVSLGELATYLEKIRDYSVLKRFKILEYAGASLRRKWSRIFIEHGIRLQAVYGGTEFGINFKADVGAADPTEYDSLQPCRFIKDHIEWESFDPMSNVYHLVIKADYPGLTTGAANRENGDYATNDLLREDPPDSDHWVYVGRMDDILVMENGENTNPTPMEMTIKLCRIVKHCTVIGQDMKCTAVLIELDLEVSSIYNPEEINKMVQDAVAEANRDAPAHSTIFPHMIYILPDSMYLPLTGKGSVMRAKAIKLYKDVIDKMYTDFFGGDDLAIGNRPKALSGDPDTVWSLHQIEEYTAETAARVLQRDPQNLLAHKYDSLVDFGLDSLPVIDMRNGLCEVFGKAAANAVFEYSSIAAIAGGIHASISTTPNTNKERYDEMQNILERYLNRAERDFAPVVIDTPYLLPDGHVVLLNGVTGTLGSFILRSLIESPDVKKIYCTVQGNPDNSMDRIAKAFEDHLLDYLMLYTGKVEAIPIDLKHEYLGWSEDQYHQLKEEVTIVQACTWHVVEDLCQPITYYDDECLSGLYNLLKFAYRPINPIIIHTTSSGPSSITSPGITEAIPPCDPLVSMSTTGYGQSNFIIEQLFGYLYKQVGFPCIVERLGQVCGDTKHGAWSTNDPFSLMILGGGLHLKKMPRLPNMVDWIPVDSAATAIVDIMLKTANTTTLNTNRGQVFNITNPNPVKWTEFLTAMRVCGMDFDVVHPEEWVQALEEHPDNPAQKLLGFYKEMLRNNNPTTPEWKTEYTIKVVVPDLSIAPAFGPELLSRCLSYWQNEGFYDPLGMA